MGILRRRRSNGLLLKICAVVVLSVIELGIAIGGFIPEAMAQDPEAYAIPQEATQMWIDVESSSVAEAGVQGTLSGQDVEFAQSPSGLTSVISTSKLHGSSVALSLEADRKLSALATVTFADKNDVIVAEYASPVNISTEPAAVVPGRPVKPAGEKSARKVVKSGFLTNLQQTGAAVTTIALIAVVLVVVSVVILVARHFNKTPLRRNQQGGAR